MPVTISGGGFWFTTTCGPQDLQETLTIAIHGSPNEPAPATNVAPLVAAPSAPTTANTTPPSGIQNNDGDLSPSDNGEQVEAA